MISDLNIVIPQSDNLPFVDLFLIQDLIETVVLLSRKNIDDHLEFTWSKEDFNDIRNSL